MPKKGKDVLAIMLGGKSSKGKGRHEEEEYEESVSGTVGEDPETGEMYIEVELEDNEE